MRVADLLVRDDGCWHCGTDQGLTVQHRANRGMGGRPSFDRPSNVILLCWWSNGECESNPDFARFARECGWKISTHADPENVPVFHWPSQLWLLLDDAWGKAAVA